MTATLVHVGEPLRREAQDAKGANPGGNWLSALGLLNPPLLGPSATEPSRTKPRCVSWPRPY
jgi:hypothetical protein